jgi:hypothetical protein
MNCVKCSAELAPGSRFCGHCGAPQPEDGAPSPQPAPVSGVPAAGQVLSMVSAYKSGFAQGSARAPEATAEALAEYEQLFAEHAEDGVIESDEAEDLARARRRLGIPEQVHLTLMQRVFEGVPARLRFDVGRAHFVVGEMAQLTFEMQPAPGQHFRSFVIHYRTTVGDGRLETYRHNRRVPSGGQEFSLSLSPPRVAGAHKLEGVLVAEFQRATFRARFDLPPLRFDHPASHTGPQQVSINVDAGKAAAGQINVGNAFAGPARSYGGVQLGGADWSSVQLQPISEAGAAEWLAPPQAPGAPPAPRPGAARFGGTALRCRGIYLNLWRASERPREVWWLRDDEVSFGRFHDPATNADVELVVEPRSNAANEEQNAFLSRRHLALRRTDRGAVVVGLSSGQRPCTLDSRPLSGGAASEPVSDGRIVVTPGLSLELTCWRDAHGAVEVVHAARRGNVEHRAHLLAGRGLGVWPDRPGYLGLAVAGGVPAPVALVWHEGSPALRNVSFADLHCDGTRVPVGECRYLQPGQQWALGPLTLEVTDEVLRERR